MKNIKSYLITAISFSLLLTALILFIPIKNAFAAQSSNEIDLMATPKKVLFDVKDFKPGDRATRTLKIKNNGSEDFAYLTSAKLKSGSDKLYNELLLTIRDKKGEIFSGKLSDFHKLEPRSLASSEEEDLVFNVGFPQELGNEFQGLTSVVEFKFYVDGTLGGVLPANGPKLPTTGTDMFNILVAGAVLVITGSIIQYSLSRRRRIDRRRV